MQAGPDHVLWPAQVKVPAQATSVEKGKHYGQIGLGVRVASLACFLAIVLWPD